MALLHLDALPPRTTKGTIVRLLVQVGGVGQAEVGKIELRWRGAIVEVPDHLASRLVKALDGTNLANRLIRAWHEPGETPRGDDHFGQLLRLLEIEGEAEAAQSLQRIQRLTPQQAEREGNSLIDLVVRDESSGLGGRALVTLSKRDAGQPLPWTRLGNGAPVLLSDQRTGQEGWRGVISERAERTVQVALAQPLPSVEEDAVWRLDLAHDEVARRRQRAALERVRAAEGDRLAELRNVLLGQQEPGFHEPDEVAPLDASLNERQQEAVCFSLYADHLAVIHGPPGTGKTTTVVELIRQAVRRGETVLACAPSNLAVDNVFEKLLAAGVAAVRIGHPARVSEQLRARTLDLMVDSHPDARLARKLVRQAFALRDRADRFRRAKPQPGAKREMRQEARRMIEDARRIESQVVQQILDSATVLCTTLTGIDSEILGQRSFDLAVIDEAAQATEPACWIPLLRSRRVVLAGDHCQLPPTVISREAAEEGYDVSLLERMMDRWGPAIARQLEVQYRMHEAIMNFSSAEFYDASLIAEDLVRHHRLVDLAGVLPCEMTETPLRLIDTAGAGYDEELEPDGESRLNVQEAELVAGQIESLISAQVAAEQIAVITPYAAQARLLRGRLSIPGLEVDTVDGFQGREKEAVVISLVRSNPRGEIGFLADIRRMNVALTRARRKLLVIGDSATIASHPFYRDLLEYFEHQGAYHTVWEDA